MENTSALSNYFCYLSNFQGKYFEFCFCLFPSRRIWKINIISGYSVFVRRANKTETGDIKEERNGIMQYMFFSHLVFIWWLDVTR